jgi:Fur family ferric uptake transcriptional regulator
LIINILESFERSRAISAAVRSERAIVKRNTKQRRAILEALARADRPLSPQEILVAARADAPRLGQATVYRNLQGLVEEGQLCPVDLPGSIRRYEPAGKDHHHHFHCRGCDQVFEIEGCPGDLRHLLPRGFRMEMHDLTLRGLCAQCRREP